MDPNALAAARSVSTHGPGRGAVVPKKAPVKAAPKVPAPKRPGAAPKAPVAATATRAAAVATGVYADAFNSLSAEEAGVRDVEGRRLRDNQAYQAWLNANNEKAAATMRGADATAAATQGAIQTATAGAQAQGQQALSALRSERDAKGGSVTAPAAGMERQRLAGDDALVQNLLGASRSRSAITAQSSQQKQGFLAAATAATGAADAARIRGESGKALTDIAGRRTDLSVRRDDTIAAQAAAEAQAQADMAKASADSAYRQQALATRVAIADATLGQRASDNAATRALRASEGKANRRAALTKSRTGKTDPLETANRKAAAETARDIPNAISDARADLTTPRPVIDIKTGKPKTDGAKAKPTVAQVRAGMRGKYKDRDVANAAIDMATVGAVNPVTIRRLKARGVDVTGLPVGRPAQFRGLSKTNVAGSALAGAVSGGTP